MCHDHDHDHVAHNFFLNKLDQISQWGENKYQGYMILKVTHTITILQ